VRHSRLRTVGVITGLALALSSACGDDGGDSANSSASTSSVTSSSAAPASTAGPTTTTGAPSGGPTTVVPTTPPGTDLGQPKLDDSSTIGTTGIDTVQFGMSLTQAEVAAGTRLLPDPSAGAGADCAVLRPEHGPADVSFTISARTIERVDVGPGSKVKTRSGAGVSTTIAELQSLYGERLSAASGSTTYVFTPVDAGDASYRVVFETDGNVVTSLRAGRTAVVASPMPCAPA
jgi:hypothetical protein